MKTLKFKTNIKCTGCLEEVTPHLNKTHGLKSWKVDLMNPDKILTAEVETAGGDELINAVKNAGFDAELMG